jgi:hypothetical protein
VRDDAAQEELAEAVLAPGGEHEHVGEPGNVARSEITRANASWARSL